MKHEHRSRANNGDGKNENNDKPTAGGNKQFLEKLAHSIKSEWETSQEDEPILLLGHAHGETSVDENGEVKHTGCMNAVVMSGSSQELMRALIIGMSQSPTLFNAVMNAASYASKMALEDKIRNNQN